MSRAEYMREYRKNAKPRNERDSYNDGFAAGVARCVKFLREAIGDRAFTGYKTAFLMQKAVTNEESFEVRERRKLIDSLSSAD